MQHLRFQRPFTLNKSFFNRGTGLCTDCVKLWKTELIYQIPTKPNGHRTSPCWNNAEVTKWDTSAWEVAKVYMTHGQQLVTSTAETDVVGLMQLVHTCGWFSRFVKNVKSFEIVSIHEMLRLSC